MPTTSSSASPAGALHLNASVPVSPYIRQFQRQASSFQSFGIEKQAKGIKILTSVLAREVLGGGALGAHLASVRGIDRLSTSMTLGAELMYERHAQSNLDTTQSELLKTGIVCHLNSLFRNVAEKVVFRGLSKPKKYEGVLRDVDRAREVLLELKAEKPDRFPSEPCALISDVFH